jgi:hypothetical protein
MQVIQEVKLLQLEHLAGQAYYLLKEEGMSYKILKIHRVKFHYQYNRSVEKCLRNNR